jgi:hypothetical protein
MKRLVTPWWLLLNRMIFKYSDHRRVCSALTSNNLSLRISCYYQIKFSVGRSLVTEPSRYLTLQPLEMKTFRFFKTWGKITQGQGITLRKTWILNNTGVAMPMLHIPSVVTVAFIYRTSRSRRYCLCRTFGGAPWLCPNTGFSGWVFATSFSVLQGHCT